MAAKKSIKVQTNYERALARAKASGIVITAGVWEAGRKEFAVTSTDQMECRKVKILGWITKCNCKDDNKHYCQHRALVRWYLISQNAQYSTIDADQDRLPVDQLMPIQVAQAARTTR